MQIAYPHGWSVCVSPQLIRQHGTWIADQELALLQPASWLNWNVTPCTTARDTVPESKFVPMLYSSGMLRKAHAELPEQPNTTWLLWNEPDRSDQANMTPTQAYTATLQFLRDAWEMGTSWEFRWAAPGVWIDAQDGLDWATEYVRLLRRHGIHRPSYWHIHSYRSPTMGHFARSWRDWQAWYTVWGASAPVVLSEACAEGADFDTQRAVMDEMREMLEREDVTGVYWYSTHRYENVWPSSSLCEVDAGTQTVKLTELGEYWKSIK